MYIYSFNIAPTPFEMYTMSHIPYVLGMYALVHAHALLAYTEYNYTLHITYSYTLYYTLERLDGQM